MHTEHEPWMQQALAQARLGEGLTRPNPPVGAVLVKNGRLVGSGFHVKAGTAHAERVALEKAGADAAGGTLYVTLEPCSTWGRTGPCTESILAAKVARVVVATRDPNPRHNGRGVRQLRRAGVEVVEHVCEPDARRLLAPFACWITTGQPFLTLKLAQSLDGRIADRRGHARWISGPESRARVHHLRRCADAIMVGSGTVLADDPQLLPRPARGRQPWRVVVDSRGRIPLRARVFSDDFGAQTIVAVTPACPARRLKELERRGATVLRLPARQGRVDLARLLRELGRMGLLHVLCEGGGELAAGLIHSGLVNRYFFILAPCLIGGGGSRPSVGGAGWLMAERPWLSIRGSGWAGQDLWIEAEPKPKEK